MRKCITKVHQKCFYLYSLHLQDISIEIPRKYVTNKPVTTKEPTVGTTTEAPDLGGPDLGGPPNTPPGLLRNTWATLEAGVTIRLFLPADYTNSTVSFKNDNNIGAFSLDKL